MTAQIEVFSPFDTFSAQAEFCTDNTLNLLSICAIKMFYKIGALMDVFSRIFEDYE